MPRVFAGAEFLVQQEGKTGRATYLQFLQDARTSTAGGAGDPAALRLDRGVAELEEVGRGWVMAGSPPIRRMEDPQLAISVPARRASADEQSRTPPSSAAQTPLELTPLPMIPRRVRESLLEEGLDARSRPAEARGDAVRVVGEFFVVQSSVLSREPFGRLAAAGRF